MLYISVYEETGNRKDKQIVRSCCWKMLEASGSRLGGGRVWGLEEGWRPECVETGGRYSRLEHSLSKSCVRTGRSCMRKLPWGAQARIRWKRWGEIWYGNPRVPDLSVWILLCWQPKEYIWKPRQRVSDPIKALGGKSGDILLHEPLTLV